MSVLISEIIPEQSFEIARSQVGKILKTEISNQLVLHGISSDLDISIYEERIIPYDISEDTYINIRLDRVDFKNKTPQSFVSDVYIFIEIFSNSIKGPVLGTIEATKLIQKIGGWCNYILNSTKTKTLGLALGSVRSSKTEQLEIFSYSDSPETSNVKIGRLTYMVSLGDNMDLDTGNELDEYFSKIKVNLTEKGYEYLIKS